MRKTKIALAFCLMTALLFSPLAGMDEHGANVVVTKKDGTLVRGELLAVKRNALVVSAGETSTGESVSIAIEDIGKVESIEKSRVGDVILWGALAGGVIGLVSGAVIGLDQRVGAGVGAEYGGLIGAFIGLGVGAIVRASISANKTFRFDFFKEDREATLLKLSEYAALKGVR